MHILIKDLLLAINNAFSNYIAEDKALFIDPEASNIKAIRVYEKAGFKKVGELCPAFNPKPHVMMRIKIDELKNQMKDAGRVMNMKKFEKNTINVWGEKGIDSMYDPRIKPDYILKAKMLRDFLLSSAEKEYLCHGDLHLENIIYHENKWLSIDPKGVIGEIAFEAAAFDLIDKREWLDPELIQDKILHRTHLITSQLNINHNRLLAWIYLRAMISAQWFIEDNGNPDEMLKLVAVLYPLLINKYQHI